MMDELFSCRNCIHNCGQSLLIGQGSGFCLQHESVIWEPDRTTCKYLHRKDLPYFVVEEGTREHAAEFAGFPFLVSLDHEKIDRTDSIQRETSMGEAVLRSRSSMRSPSITKSSRGGALFRPSPGAWTAAMH